MALLVPQGEPPHDAPCLGVRVGRAVALPVVQHHQPLGTWGNLRGHLDEYLVGVYPTASGFLARVLGEVVLEPLDEGARRGLSPLDGVLARHEGVCVGTEDPGPVLGFCGLANDDVRGARDMRHLAWFQYVEAYQGDEGVAAALSDGYIGWEAELFCGFFPEAAHDLAHLEHLLGKLVEQVVQPE